MRAMELAWKRKTLEDLADELKRVADGLEREQRCVLPVVELFGDEESVVAMLDNFGINRVIPRI